METISSIAGLLSFCGISSMRMFALVLMAIFAFFGWVLSRPLKLIAMKRRAGMPWGRRAC